MTLCRRHVVINQFLTRFTQARSLGIGTDTTRLQILYPLLQRSDGHFIELIHANQEVFGKDSGGKFMNDGVLFFRGDFQMVARMNTCKGVLAVIKVIVPLTDVEVEDADGVNLLHGIVTLAQADMLGNGFGNAIEDALQVVQLAGVLYLHDDDFALAVQCFDVHTVELVICGLLVALALKQLDDGNLLIQKYGEEAFEHTEVGFLAKEALHRPVKTDISVRLIHIIQFIWQLQR